MAQSAKRKHGLAIVAPGADPWQWLGYPVRLNGTTCGGFDIDGIVSQADTGIQANGSLFLISPIGIRARQPETADRYAREDSSLTRPTEICMDARAVFAALIAGGICWGDRREMLQLALAHAPQNDVKDVLNHTRTSAAKSTNMAVAHATGGCLARIVMVSPAWSVRRHSLSASKPLDSAAFFGEAGRNGANMLERQATRVPFPKAHAQDLPGMVPFCLLKGGPGGQAASGARGIVSSSYESSMSSSGSRS